MLAATTLSLVVLAGGMPVHAQSFPERISLPSGFQPEGIASGAGSEFFAGSLANGAIFKGNFRTGAGGVFIPGEAGRVSVGMKYDTRSGLLFVAGGPTGKANVFDTTARTLIASYQLASAPTFINDVILTRDAAYFTDSQAARLFRLPLGAAGALPDASAVTLIPLGGDWSQVSGFNANGITATPDGKTLFVINSTIGAVFKVDPASGSAVRITDPGALTAGDGILLDGKTLYVVRNRLNQIAVVDLSPDFANGAVVGTITSPYFRVPTTVAEFGNRLYVVNARFGTPPGPGVDYDAVQVSK
jgi:sugar lactone lactonase YvrE